VSIEQFSTYLSPSSGREGGCVSGFHSYMVFPYVVEFWLEFLNKVCSLTLLFRCVPVVISTAKWFMFLMQIMIIHYWVLALHRRNSLDSLHRLIMLCNTDDETVKFPFPDFDCSCCPSLKMCLYLILIKHTLFSRGNNILKLHYFIYCHCNVFHRIMTFK